MQTLKTAQRLAPVASTPGILARAAGLLLGLLAVSAGYPVALLLAVAAGMYVGGALDEWETA